MHRRAENILEMGKNPTPARSNRTRMQVLPTTETNQEVKNMQEPEPNRTLPAKNRTEPELKCHGSYSVLSLNETVGTLIHFTVTEGFYFT